MLKEETFVVADEAGSSVVADEASVVADKD